MFRGKMENEQLVYQEASNIESISAELPEKITAKMSRRLERKGDTFSLKRATFESIVPLKY